MLTLAHLAMLEHHAAAGIMLAVEPDAQQPVGLMAIAVAAATVAVVAGRALARLLAVIVETMRMALRLAALLAGVLFVLGISIVQLLPI
ncbi:hypothetical protein OHA72_06410 [Dactylosporangium sp. NBC_01737]|uniref:hypothetical protein n=1 Tax=Dactylosporangium sp. NBC_01737 TaxID=2975959 RepID=UPI002E0D2CA8|nr:hypothetical protein OHA72_06410 [Dactylosporangium sp. NBC_01737]